ncbi:hypothetical protein QE364_000952 [Nocardioides zeae]|uniref:Uncharacterized protein n=1 Tax=Nocardioides zeae TaxID=1457234 RepID=A0ACC6IF30_9ACTN|nr:hypothetical protein [Nocardioides zeae]MDR6174930.1 hypothetical protein [Nocardioides zeae]MDR6209260.1 hypothetical protein [Nocardioides zeae]
MNDHRCVGHVGGLFLEMAGRDGAVPAVLVRDRDGLVLRVDDTVAFGRVRAGREVRDAAALMAARGVVVRVECRGRALVTLGVPAAPWWQRALTGAAHVRLHAWPAVVRRGAARDRRRQERTTSGAVDVAAGVAQAA